MPGTLELSQLNPFKMANLFKKNWIIVLLLLFACIFRFYKLSDWFFFNIDEDWYSYIVRKVVVYKRPVLIGWEIPGGITIPPIMYYWGSLVMLIFNNNPLGYAVTASFISIIGVLLIYYTGKKIFNSEKIGLYASIIYCFSYLVNIYNRLSITLFLGPVLAVLTYLSLYKVVKEKKIKWLYILSVVFILATQEGSMISLILLSIIILFSHLKKIKIKDYFFPLFLFLFITITPILIFDIRHNFQSTKKFISIFSQNKEENVKEGNFLDGYKLLFNSLPRMLFITGPNDLNTQILPCPAYKNIVSKATPSSYWLLGFIIILIFALKSLFNSKQVYGQRLIISHLLIIFTGLTVFSYIMPSHLHEWFFILLTPAFSFIIGYFLNQLSLFRLGKLITIAFLSFFVVFNLDKIITGTSIVGYKDKLHAARFASDEVDNLPFVLNMLGDGCNGYGYRYLFTYLGKEPVGSYMDYLYLNWLYKTESNVKPALNVTIVPLTDLTTNELRISYNDLKRRSLKNKRFGNVEILILGDKEFKDDPPFF